MVKLFVGLSLLAGAWAVMESRAALRHAGCVMSTASTLGEHPESAAVRLASCD